MRTYTSLHCSNHFGRIFRTNFEAEQDDLESFLNFFIIYSTLIREPSISVGRYSADVIR